MPSWRLYRVVWKKAIQITGREVRHWSVAVCICTKHQNNARLKHWVLVYRKTHPSSCSDKLPRTRGSKWIWWKLHAKGIKKSSTPSLPSLGTKYCCKMLSLFRLDCSHKEEEYLKEFHKVHLRIHRNLWKRVIWIYITGGCEKKWISLLGCFCDFLLSHIVSSASSLKKPCEENYVLC